MTRAPATLIVLTTLLAGARAAEPSDDWGADFDVGPAAEPTEPEATWSGVFSAQSRVGLWLERLDTTPLSTLRTSLDGSVEYARGPLRLQLAGHAEVDPAFALQRPQYDQPTYDRYVALIDVRKTHIGWRATEGDITFGYQVVPWGEALMLGALDITNPRDLREPGLAEPEALRLPVLSTRVGIGQGGQRLELLWVHEAHFGYRSPPLGPYSLYRALLPDDVEQRLDGRALVVADYPDRYGERAQQLFLRWTYRGPGLDLAVYAASALDQFGVPGVFDPLADPDLEQVPLPLVHRRMWMTGLSGVVPLSTVLLKWELGVFTDRPLTRVTAEGSHVERQLALDLLASVVWDASPDTQIALEWQSLLLPERPEGAEYLLHPDVPRYALRVSHRMLSDRLVLELVALLDADLGGVLSAVVRAGAEYEIAQGWRVGVMAATYHPSSVRSGPLTGFDRNDQLIVKARWDVAL